MHKRMPFLEQKKSDKLKIDKGSQVGIQQTEFEGILNDKLVGFTF